MAAIVITDTPALTNPAIQWISLPMQAVLKLSLNSAILYVTSIGWAKRPITKSEPARQQMRTFEGECRGGDFQMTKMIKMLHRVATKANAKLMAQQIISAIKTPPVCESSTLVKKKHFVALFVSIFSMASTQKRHWQEFQFAGLLENACENADIPGDIKFQIS